MIGLPMAYHALGRKAESDIAFAELLKKPEEDFSFNFATVCAFRGETDRCRPRRDRGRTPLRDASEGPSLASLPAQDRNCARTAHEDRVQPHATGAMMEAAGIFAARRL
jgi:hypothetical protein